MVSISSTPIRYPKTPPRTEPIEQIKAYLKDLSGMDIAKAISSISGGIGKKDDSQKARIKRADAP